MDDDSEHRGQPLLGDAEASLPRSLEEPDRRMYLPEARDIYRALLRRPPSFHAPTLMDFVGSDMPEEMAIEMWRLSQKLKPEDARRWWWVIEAFCRLLDPNEPNP